MTTLQQRKTRLAVETSNEVRSRGRYRAIVLELQPQIMLVRLKGTRTAFPISYEAIYSAAAKLETARVRAEKKAKRG